MLSAIVIGGGIAGLATGVALQHSGISVTLFERCSTIREVGAGLSLWSNGVKALYSLGLEEEALAEASVVRELVTVTENSRQLSSLNMDEVSRSFGAPSISIQRGKLQQILYRALGEDRVRTGLACVRVEQSPAGLTVNLNDGTVAVADFLVAADGIHSAVRAQLHPNSKLRYHGWYAWRGLLRRTSQASKSEIEWPLDVQWLIAGCGVQGSVCPCGAESLFWYVSVNGSADPSMPPDERKQKMMRVVREWPTPVLRVIEATLAEDIVENDLIDFDPLPIWGSGRITFAGDAIHATTPHLGQGAALAMEDAVGLAGCFRAAGSIEDTLRTYEQMRQSRTKWITLESRRTGRVLQMSNPLLVKMRNAVIPTRFVQQLGLKLFQRIMTFDPAAISGPLRHEQQI